MSEFRKNIILDPNTRIWFDYKLKTGKPYFTVITHNNRMRMYWEENPDSYVVLFLDPQRNKNLDLVNKIETLAHCCWYAEHNPLCRDFALEMKVKEWS